MVGKIVKKKSRKFQEFDGFEKRGFFIDYRLLIIDDFVEILRSPTADSE